MSNQTNAEYFAGRAVIERAMSKVATDKRAAAIHADLAERYDELALEFSTSKIVPFPAVAEPRQASAN